MNRRKRSSTGAVVATTSDHSNPDARNNVTQAAVPSFVDGRRIHCSGETFVKLDPNTGLDLARLHKGRQSDVDAAMVAAQRGLRRWSATSVAERLRILRRAAELMRQ